MPSKSSTSPKDPDDWSSITESAQRRKVQNRISQRNHRQRVRARIAQLEAAVASSGIVVPNTELPSRATKGSRASPHLCHVFPLSEDSSTRSSEYSPSPITSKACSPQLAYDSIVDLPCGVKLEPERASPILQSVGEQHYPSPQFQQKSMFPRMNGSNISATTIGWERPQTVDDLAMRFPTLHAMFSPQTPLTQPIDDYLFDNDSDTSLTMSPELTSEYIVEDSESWTCGSTWNVQPPESLDQYNSFETYDFDQWRQYSAVSTTDYVDSSSAAQQHSGCISNDSHQHMMLHSTAARDGYRSHCVCQQQLYNTSRSPTPSGTTVKLEASECDANQIPTAFCCSTMASC